MPSMSARELAMAHPMIAFVGMGADPRTVSNLATAQSDTGGR
jgi:hypothetical protein